MVPTSVDWAKLEALAKHMAEPGIQPGSVPEGEWRVISQTLNNLRIAQDWSGIIRLRETFTDLLARDTVWGLAIMKDVDGEAILAARYIHDKPMLAHLLGARGHNFHREGQHHQAIQVFAESATLYNEIGAAFAALKSYYMTSLCYRALGDRNHARFILNDVLARLDANDPWRGNPLQVMAWLARDERQWHAAEALLTEALHWQEQSQNPDILVAGTLADLGELVGLQGRTNEATAYFAQSLRILQQHEGQYDRQEARTKLKLAELLIRSHDYQRALRLLDEADDKIRVYGHYYDLMWRIELTRALVYARQAQFIPALRKIRAAIRYRQQLGLSISLLVKPALTRWRNIFRLV